MCSQKNKATPFIRLIIGLGLLLILLIVLFSVVRQATSPPQGALSTPVIRFTSAQSPFPFEQERETVEAAVMQTHWALIETWTPQSLPFERSPTRPPASFVPGIYEIPDTSFGYWKHWAISSRWQDVINNERVRVYAGAIVDTSIATPDITQGLVVVEVYSKDLSNRS